jgi:hypothetical protein
MGLSNHEGRVGTDTLIRSSVYVSVKFTPLSFHKILPLYITAIPIVKELF